jgi:hypothetical protein
VKFSPASSTPKRYLSQNQIESDFLDYVFGMISPALRPVLVADRGFARAELFRELQALGRDFVIRMDAETHIRIPEVLGEGLPTEGRPGEVLGLREGDRVFCPLAWYGKEDQVPVSLLAMWGKGYKEPWYLVGSMDSQETEVLYRWRMRLEATNRDEKTGVLLREKGDHHDLSNSLHFHRLMLALASAEWLCALTGLQAWNDLPKEAASCQTCLPHQFASPKPLPSWMSDLEPEEGPVSPPPVIPHRGKTPRLPSWIRPFAARGMLSYVRLGLEILRCPDPPPILHHMLRWLASYLWIWTPLWRPHQIRYRLAHWWNYDP